MTTRCFDREDETFIVRVNHEGQYSIWPHWKPVPGGGVAQSDAQRVLIQGDKKIVSDYVEKHWTDMRPLSLQKAMAEPAAATAPKEPSAAAEA